MKKLALLLFAASSVFIGCAEPGDPVKLGEVELNPNLKKVEAEIAVRNKSGGLVLDEDKNPVLETKDVNVIPVPFYVDHYFLAEGWMGGYDGGVEIAKNCPSGKTTDGGYIEEDKLSSSMYNPDFDLCRHWTFTPNFKDSLDRTNWGGVAWLQQTNWGTRIDDLIRIDGGARSISFWARSGRDSTVLYNDTNNTWGLWFTEKSDHTTKCKKHNHHIQIALCTDKKESCDWNPESFQYVIPLTGKWQFYEINIPKDQYFENASVVGGKLVTDTIYNHTSDTPHRISSSFIWTNAKNDVPGDDPLDFYVDRIRYSTKEADSEYTISASPDDFGTRRTEENANAQLLTEGDCDE